MKKYLLGDCKQDLRTQSCSRGFISRKLAARLPAPGDLAAALRTCTLLTSREGACEEKLLVCLVPRLGAQYALLSLKPVHCVRTSQAYDRRRLKT